MTTSAAINLDHDFTIHYDAPSGLMELAFSQGTFTTHEDDVDRWMRAGAEAIADGIFGIWDRGDDGRMVQIDNAPIFAVDRLPTLGQAIYVGSFAPTCRHDDGRSTPGNEY
jgi:hypothetical protein